MVSGLKKIEVIMREMVDGKSKPYDAGRQIWSEATCAREEMPDVMHPLWLIWGALTDWFELRPLETHAAEEAMLRSAREWLALNQNDEIALGRYFDQWIFEELGYERKSS